MIRYKLGDTVIISPILAGNDYGEEFHKFVNKQATIAEVNFNTYYINLDNGIHPWFAYELCPLTKNCNLCNQCNTCDKTNCKKEELKR